MSTPVAEPPVATPVDETANELPADIAELNAHVARTGLLGDVFFAYDESALDEAARDRLMRNADFFRAHPEYAVTVEGHCDSRGTNDYNLALGERRAAAATSYLRSLGVGANLRTVSYGEERPVCWEEHESCWSQNRRAHFVITGRSDAN